MPFSLDIINICILIVIILNSALGIFVLLTKRDSIINQFFFIFSLAATLWGVSMFLFRSAGNTEYSVLFARILYASAAAIPFVFVFFIRVFPKELFSISRRVTVLLFLPFLAVTAISVVPDLLISGTSAVPGQEQIIYFDQFYHSIYAAYIIIYFAICYGMLFFKYLKFQGIEKKQINYVILGTFIATLIGVTTNLIMPYLGDFHLNWMGQIGIVAMVGGISYSILRHRLFEVKVVATQFIVFVLCFSLFTRLLLSSSRSDFIINSSFLAITIIIGILLVKSVIKEVEQRQKLEVLAKDLESANNRLQELDQLKSEFLSLATHQIRAPLTAIKGYASLILEGDYGPVSSRVGHAVDTILNSCQSLVVIVNEFLNISRIEQGRMKYEMLDFDLSELISSIMEELQPMIQKTTLSVAFKPVPGEKFMIHADQEKMKQVIENLIDNSIKYTPHGGVGIALSHVDGSVRLSITDTGIGLAAEDIPKLFAKFMRARDANKTNVIGTGLGLYIAKQMVTAQGGRIWVESPGTGKGSTFFVDMPEAAPHS